MAPDSLPASSLQRKENMPEGRLSYTLSLQLDGVGIRSNAAHFPILSTCQSAQIGLLEFSFASSCVLIYGLLRCHSIHMVW
jgi:hypothetical protein